MVVKQTFEQITLQTTYFWSSDENHFHSKTVFIHFIYFSISTLENYGCFAKSFETQNVWLFSGCTGLFLGRRGEFVTLVDLHIQISFFPCVKISYIFWLYLLRCLLETCLILISVMDTQEVWHPFHFPPNIFSLSCQLYTLKILVNIVCFIREKSYWISTLISLSKLMRKIPKDRLSSGERMVLWSSFMNVCCITWEGGSEWNQMVVDA